jgi:hypothetical protein
VAVIERAGAEGVAQLRGELGIRAEARIEFAVDFADHAGARVFRDAFGEEAFNLRFDRGDDAFDGGGVGGVEEGELRFVCAVADCACAWFSVSGSTGIISMGRLSVDACACISRG